MLASSPSRSIHCGNGPTMPWILASMVYAMGGRADEGHGTARERERERMKEQRESRKKQRGERCYVPGTEWARTSRECTTARLRLDERVGVFVRSPVSCRVVPCRERERDDRNFRETEWVAGSLSSHVRSRQGGGAHERSTVSSTRWRSQSARGRACFPSFSLCTHSGAPEQKIKIKCTP